MGKTKKLTCIITRKTVVISGDYLEKKIQEYQNEDNLDKFYICKEAKNFLKKGYSILETRKLLNVTDDEDLPSKDVMDSIEKEYKKFVKTNDILPNISAFTYNKSDPEVEHFINTITKK